MGVLGRAGSRGKEGTHRAPSGSRGQSNHHQPHAPSRGAWQPWLPKQKSEPGSCFGCQRGREIPFNRDFTLAQLLLLSLSQTTSSNSYQHLIRGSWTLSRAVDLYSILSTPRSDSLQPSDLPRQPLPPRPPETAAFPKQRTTTTPPQILRPTNAPRFTRHPTT